MEKKTSPDFIELAIEKLLYIVEKIVAILFIIVTGATLLQVLFRYVFNAPLLWTEEIARYFGIWFIMLANARAIKDKSHVNVDIFVAKAPAVLKKIISILVNTITLFVMSYLSYYIFIMIQKFFNTPSPALRIPMGIVYIGFFAGCFISSLVSLFILIEDIANAKAKALSKKEGELA